MVVLEAPVVGKRVHDVPRKRVRMVYEDDPLHERTLSKAHFDSKMQRPRMRWQLVDTHAS